MRPSNAGPVSGPTGSGFPVEALQNPEARSSLSFFTPLKDARGQAASLFFLPHRCMSVPRPCGISIFGDLIFLYTFLCLVFFKHFRFSSVSLFIVFLSHRPHACTSSLRIHVYCNKPFLYYPHTPHFFNKESYSYFNRSIERAVKRFTINKYHAFLHTKFPQVSKYLLLKNKRSQKAF